MLPTGFILVGLLEDGVGFTQRSGRIEPFAFSPPMPCLPVTLL